MVEVAFSWSKDCGDGRLAGDALIVVEAFVGSINLWAVGFHHGGQGSGRVGHCQVTFKTTCDQRVLVAVMRMIPF